MNMGRVLGLFGCAGDFEDAHIQIRHLDVRHAICRRAIPAIANGFGEVSILLTLECIMKDQRALFAEPRGVVLRGGCM